MRRTKITPAQIETILRWLFFAACAAVALAAIFYTPGNLPPSTLLLVLALAVVEPVVRALVPRRLWPRPSLLLALVDVAIGAAIYFVAGAEDPFGFLLLLPLVGLAATHLVLENALAVATIGSLVFSMDLILAPSGLAFGPTLLPLVFYLVASWGLVLIIHFAITGQHEATVRRERESALAEARRVIDQEKTLVQLSREISNAGSLEDTLQIVLETIRKYVPFKGGSIQLVDGSNQLYIAASIPPVDPEVGRLRLPIGQGISGWIAEKQEPFYSPDLDRESRISPSFRTVGSNANIKSYLAVPLLTRSHCVGVMQVDSAQVDAFTPEHQRLLQQVAAQVSGTIENARLLREREEFSRRLQEIYDAANGLTSQFDLDVLLEECARQGSELLGARYAAVAVLDEKGRIERFATAGLSEAERSQLMAMPDGHGLLTQVFQEQKVLRVDDTSLTTNNAGLPPGTPPLRTLLAAPLIARGETQGAMYLADKLDGGPFTPADEELLLILTAGASAAVSNAQLYLQLRRNIEQLYALHQIGQAIGSSLSPDEVFHVFDVDVRHLCGAEASVVSEWNAAGSNLALQNEQGAADLLQARRLPPVKEQVDRAARGGPAITLTMDSPAVEGGKIFAYLAPLIVRGRVLGLAEIYAHFPTLLSPESSSIFLTLVAQLAVSMENARLYTQLQKREAQLRNFVGKLFEAEDRERRRLAYDIHDGLAQLIVSADIHLNTFASMRSEDTELAEQQLEKGLARLQASLTEVRRVVSELRPSTLDDFGLINTLKRYVEQLARDQGWEYTFEENLGEMRLDPAIETGAYRIVQESLSNIRKYSDTPRVEVDIRQEGDELHVRVQDWGKGFDLEEARQREGHFGLSSMEERARLLGGTFRIDARPGEGTRVDVFLPCYRAVPTARL